MFKTNFDFYGLECRAGWATLYQPLIERCRQEGVAIHQVRERFGALRFSAGSAASDELIAAIAEAEARSRQMCEICGNPSAATQSRRRLRTRCALHEDLA